MNCYYPQRWRLWLAKGFQGPTIHELASRAGVATGTVYKYFSSKSELCAAVFRRATDIEVSKVRAKTFPSQPPLPENAWPMLSPVLFAVLLKGSVSPMP